MNNWVETSSIGAARIVSLVALVIVLTLAVFTELKENRIPNWLTMGGMGTGLILAYFPGGISLASSLGGLAFGFGVLFVFYMFGGMGGGDVKLMGAVGALLGHGLIVHAVVYTALIGGLMSIFVLIWRGKLIKGIQKALLSLVRRKAPEATPEEDLGTMPYGLAIVFGCLMALFMNAR